MDAKPGEVITYSGLLVDPAQVREDQLNLEDIAHHLAQWPRFGGACRHFYSVAQHSVEVAKSVWSETHNANTTLLALFHDGGEYLLGDRQTPLIREYICFETANEMVKDTQVLVEKRFVPGNISEEDRRIVRDADWRMMRREAEAFLENSSWLDDRDQILPLHIIAKDPTQAEIAFLQYYRSIVELME